MSLFNKFSYASKKGPIPKELDSIIKNLQNVLNTRRGYGSVLNEFGIRDLNEYSSKEILSGAVMEEVKENIRRFEPRVELVDIKIEEDDNPFKLSFKIECRLKSDPKALRMIFDTVFNNISVENWAKD